MTEGIRDTEDAASARAAEQARLRKQRREAKIKAGGTARLNKITGLGGGIQRDPQAQPDNQPGEPSASAPAPDSEQHADPDEVDISEHYFVPQNNKRAASADSSNMSEAQLRQMMLGLDRPSPPPGPNPFVGPPPMAGMAGMRGMEGVEGMEQDPMTQMLSKMMAGGLPGGAGGAPGSNIFAGTPMEGLFGAGGANPMQQAQQVAANKTANLWRILHAMFALGLGLCVALSTTFTGTKAEREHGSLESTGLLGERSIEQTRAYFFYVFTSVEALLLTTRYFLDKGQSAPSGWMWTASGFLPSPVKGYVQHALRYAQIFSTVRNDALLCVFVMGICCLLRA
ncbi:hypothetical protein F4780DRAFT_771857 [Xylariomycetidae sp. FL0641]|nr:hypothetical protein F4780DRAFT_784923 [Xylariomycetidae sp. FL0641]KAI0018250.1 hypothetical protein F4780DRAFT_771857 [Xylariomycetidae sp. FL0641]